MKKIFKFSMILVLSISGLGVFIAAKPFVQTPGPPEVVWVLVQCDCPNMGADSGHRYVCQYDYSGEWCDGFYALGLYTDCFYDGDKSVCIDDGTLDPPPPPQ